MSKPLTHSRAGATETEIRRALSVCRTSFLTAAFFSLFINLLLLVPSFYMLEVYDRVLSSSSESTLLMLTLIVVFLFTVMGGLEWIRSQIMIAMGSRLDGLLGGRAFDAMFARTLATGGKIASAQPLSDVVQLRQFLSGPGLIAFFDAPWVPIYLTVMFLFHPWYGVVGIVSAVVLLTLTVWNEASTKGDLDKANSLAIELNQETQHNLRNAEAIAAMGMLPRLRSRWEEKQAAVLALQMQVSRRGGLITTLAKIFRILVQSMVLGLGAYLALKHEITPGLLIAGAILLGRALAPLDLMIAGWRGFLAARGAYRRLETLLALVPARQAAMQLPAPLGEIRLESASVTPPGAASPVLKGINLVVEPGTLLAVIGPSGAGKSTLLRAILGLYQPLAGSVRLDGAEAEQWDREQLGQYIGYLPQDVELLEGSVAENIARFGPVNSEEVVNAARAARVHDLILRLPEGYETRLASNGNILSAGQKQRLGLARALYRMPRFVILDEPNSNLDQEGESALIETLRTLRTKGCTVLVVSHRGSLLEQVDKIAVMLEGQVVRVGPREQVLASLQNPAVKFVGTPRSGLQAAAS